VTAVSTTDVALVEEGAQKARLWRDALAEVRTVRPRQIAGLLSPSRGAGHHGRQ
jgi:hypothetical protein